MSFTELYCDPVNGNTLNAGSTTSGTPAYTSAGGNWANSTRIFTPTDGSNPSTSVSVGDLVSVYVTASATQATFVGRVTAVQNAVNGTITVSSTFAGTNPANGTGTMTLRAGGAWKGPNGTLINPFNLSNLGNLYNSNTDTVRINLKNNGTYSVTASIGVASGGIAGGWVQGYTSTPGDGGRATIDGGTSNIILFQDSVSSGATYADLIFANNASAGTSHGFDVFSATAMFIIRVTVHGMRGAGIRAGPSCVVIESEVYDCGKANSSTSGSDAGFTCASNTVLIRCYSHDNTGSNIKGFEFFGGTGPAQMFNCIADSNGAAGIHFIHNGSDFSFRIFNCDCYNNGGDGLYITRVTGGLCNFWIENCNFIKNTGYGLNNQLATQYGRGFVYNCGYGAGSQANGSGDSVLGEFIESGKVTYTSGTTPYNNPASGDFSIVGTEALGVGRGEFTESDGSNSGTVGFPDIGAAQEDSTGSSPTYSVEGGLIGG